MLGKTAVISGASGGIGLALAKAFILEGYDVALIYNKNKSPLEELLLSFPQNSSKIVLIKADLSTPQGVDKAVDKINSEFKKVDVLINNAGISLVKLFDETTLEEYDNMFDVNVKSIFMLTKALVKGMIHNKQGNIINISSMWGISGASMEVVYSASKAAIIGMSKALSKEVGPSNINVNVIAPGVIDTKMNENLSEEDIKALKEETLIGRIGKASDVANMAIFLASENASFITGQVIGVDGGFIV